MPTDRRCERCGNLISPGQAECPICAAGEGISPARRDTILLLSLLLLALLFVVTGFAVTFYHVKEKSLAGEWYLRGEAELKAGRAEQAVGAFRTALVYSRDNSLYRLRLAQALMAADRLEEAEAYLLNLWDSEPGSGTVNLELARLAERKDSVAEATRYFHNAIYGVWEKDPAKNRRQARLELSRFLLDHGAKAEADAELIALSSDLPRDPAMLTEVGQLFLKAEDYRRAFVQFRDALRLGRKQEAALAGAGEAAFQLGSDREAQQYLEQALREAPKNAAVAERLETTKLILAANPFEPGLSSMERSRRAVRAFELSLRRLQSCLRSVGTASGEAGTASELQVAISRALKLRPKVRERNLRLDPDLLSSTMNLVFDNEELAARDCGAPQGGEFALLLIGRRQRGSER